MMQAAPHPEIFLDGRVTLHGGDCMDVLSRLEEASIDACVTDPPYHLTSIVKRFTTVSDLDVEVAKATPHRRTSSGFMGKQWDGGDIAFRPETWAAVYRVMKPGAHLLAFSGTRTYHRMVCAIEDAGFEIRDCIQWVYGSGFPKSHDVSKGIDRAAGAEREVVGSYTRGLAMHPGNEGADNWRENYTGHVSITAPATNAAREWQGWGTALKPACEPIVLARKPLIGTVAENVLQHGTGAINIDGCRIPGEVPSVPQPNLTPGHGKRRKGNCGLGASDGRIGEMSSASGRWPANVIHVGSEEVVGAFPDARSAGDYPSDSLTREGVTSFGGKQGALYSDSGSAARFFYQVKQDEPCLSIRDVSDVGERFDLKSERVVSVLIRAVEASTHRLALQRQSYRGTSIAVTATELEIICASVTEIIQNLERRYSLGFPHENLEARLPGVRCVAIPKRIGTTTITVDRSTLGPFVELATFDITETSEEVGASGSARRFWYSSKADSDDRLGSKHPTVKPLDLMQYLVRLITPKGGLVLDPFSGTGTTGEAAWREGMRAVLIEREAEYQKDIRRRMELALSGPDERVRESIKASGKVESPGPLFEDWP
jgi:DNA modification methylase